MQSGHREYSKQSFHSHLSVIALAEFTGVPFRADEEPPEIVSGIEQD